MKIFRFIMFFLIFPITMSAQLPTQLEEEYFPNSGRNIVYKTIITKDSAYLVVGEKESTIGGYDQDLAIIKINKHGEKEWQIIYDEKLNWAIGYDIKELDNGDLIVLGEILKDFKDEKKDLILFKVSSNGKIIWRKKHSLPINNNLRKIQISNLETIILIGEEKRSNKFYFLVLSKDGTVANEFHINKNAFLQFEQKK